MMLPKLTRIDGMTLQLVHRWKIAPWFRCETVEMWKSHVELLHFYLSYYISGATSDWRAGDQSGNTFLEKPPKHEENLSYVKHTVEYTADWIFDVQPNNKVDTHALGALFHYSSTHASIKSA